VRRLLSLPLYPLLIAGYFPLYPMAANWDYFDIGDLVRPLVVCTLCALLGVAIITAVVRDVHRAALWAALLLIPVLYIWDLHGLVIAVSGRWNDQPSGTAVMAGILAVLVPVGVLARPGRNFTQVANVATAVMVAFSAVALVLQASASSEIMAVARSDAELQRRSLFSTARADAGRPNIIHIVLDGYSRRDVLADLYRFDNAEFLDALRQMGVAVADQATTPYGQTLLVMNSILSGDYLGEAGPYAGSSYRRFLKERLNYNPVMETLSRLGYRLAATDVQYEPVQLRRLDRVHSFLLSNFESLLFEKTSLFPIFRAFGVRMGWATRELFATPFERALPSPFFLYVHAIAPHPPFDVDRHGNPVPQRGRSLDDGTEFTKGSAEGRRLYRDGYLDKLQFVNGAVLSYVGRIVAEMPDPKVIIIHGDHGGALYLDHNHHEASCLKERFSPLLAVYSTDGRLQRALADNMNLVNLYRLVFNAYFATDLPFLPNRSFFSPWVEPEARILLTSEQLGQFCPGGLGTAESAGGDPGLGRRADQVISAGR
jgi:hypothetical protein